ncbi:MAG: shikimate 5-dehydrogenase [Mogibacterium sp.]|nr:shikimate 5-dehydrogenase [Mogibacterium sp.]
MSKPRLGLIGKPLGHSWSPEIHKYLTGADYKLWEIDEGELPGFMKRREFDGINVTIPYKASVIEYLEEIDEAADRMGAVNCIVNRDGRLKGYNTDYIGLLKMMKRMDAADKAGGGKAVILGTGGASKAAEEACRKLGIEFEKVSRSEREGCITYEELKQRGEEFALLINATPVGMYPNEDEAPVDVSQFGSLGLVVDIVANPVRTRLCYEAEQHGIPSAGGLEMLVYQALAAEEIFTGEDLPEAKADECVEQLLAERRNIVLIGMPSSGKSTVGRLLAERLGREFIDTDDEIVSRAGRPIAEIFAEDGEAEFRKIEREVCEIFSKKSGLVIACGGGVVEFEENMRRLAYNGIIIYLDRSLELLTPTESRPLSPDKNKLAVLYERRKELYERYSDIRIRNDGSAEDAADEIIREIQNEL